MYAYIALLGTSWKVFLCLLEGIFSKFWVWHGCFPRTNSHLQIYVIVWNTSVEHSARFAPKARAVLLVVFYECNVNIHLIELRSPCSNSSAFLKEVFAISIIPIASAALVVACSKVNPRTSATSLINWDMNYWLLVSTYCCWHVSVPGHVVDYNFSICFSV